ncbi:response regulator [Bradyrhizobium erythrophlei]|uniref:histidine kinase n=1 Tax=Bradyrhizobium erythrophlei TaxID=1437360 RepID=A0A1M5PWH8_9BRAD|nr:response regulator [Bradyrhizobium erythrophlei]SHH05603.1 PAS/PAC sensor hybrid histidine kinase [Bradyrhizobium erythrophlei]
MKTPLRILLLEDDAHDAELIQEFLEADHFVCEITRTQTRAEFVAALEDVEIDVILADYTLPSFDGLSALMLASSARPDLPFIFVSGTLGEEVAIEALKIGATDYVVKTRLSRLVPSVQRALREADERAERKTAAKVAAGREEASIRTPLRILLLEDDAHDAELIQELLETDHFVCETTRVQTRAEFLAALKNSGIDLILADYQLPSFDGLSALKLAQSERPDLPFIFVSGTLGEEVAIEALKIGATDYILKTRLARLVPSVQRALREARERAERRMAEEISRRSEKELLDVIEAIPIMAFTSLADGSNVWANRRWVEYTGLSEQNTSGSGWRSTLHPDDVDGHVTKWQEALASGEPFESEARHRSVNGEYRWFLVRAVPLRDENGKIRKWYGTLTDIEDRKGAEQEREGLRQLEAHLAYMSRVMTMGELAASLGHEIKQPIAAAAISAEACMRWLRRDTPDVTEASEAASATVAAVTRAGGIIDRVSSLYRRGRPERESVDLNEIAREMSLLLGDTANQNAVSIRTDLDPELPMTTADCVQLQQVLMNLMLNGIEAMRDTGGELTVASKGSEDGQLLISVSDAGTGLPVNESERIFEAFFTTKAQGTGMGLSISRRIIESHGGHLWAGRNTGRGAIFQFTLLPT